MDRVIQWYPGHMQKAKRLMTEKMNLIDVVFELVDARIPFSSTNPFVNEIIKNKPRVVLLNKADKADERKTKEWIKYYQSIGVIALAIDSLNGDGVNKIINGAKTALKEKIEKDKAKGLKEKSIRALIVGIPNVGKSTLINRLAKRKVAKIGDRPGVTKSEQWIKVGNELELLDTPGILWNKFDEVETGYRLALTGAIKDEILPIDDVVIYGIKYYAKNHPNRIIKRYNLSQTDDPITVLDEIGKSRGCLRGREIDYERVYTIFLNDLRGDRLGRITLDDVPV
ncbi:ribosome biogenesis GTPase YlqF [Mycoplasmatota bacterium]|nr:ribosome biogenesis GTPase YlqF [Mycoplasmatota bacterium]